MRKNERTIPISAETRQLIERQRAAFRKQFGREPGPDDPIFFDPDCAYPRPVPQQKQENWKNTLVAAMVKAAIDPAAIYAFNKTDRMVTAENKSRLNKAELAEWEDAIVEYYSKIDTRKIQG
ncbi:MAG: hypothetical protein ACLQLC_17900 [Candidatus Sulfotelmatobacter sp.]